MNEGGACVYIFLEQYGFGPFSHGEIFFHAISYAELSELGGGCRVEGVLTPLALFLLWTLSEPWGQIMPTKLIHAFRIFTPSYGSASCFRSKFFLPSCPRLGDIEKDKYTYMKVGIFKLATSFLTELLETGFSFLSYYFFHWLLTLFDYIICWQNF